MALVVKDRVQETSTTTGTGTLTLLGAVSGFQSFSVIGNANTTYYAIVMGTDFEVGIGTYTSSGTTLSRTTVLESSNSGSLVNFSAGTKNVFVTYPAEKAVYQDANGTAIAPQLSASNGILENATTVSSNYTIQTNFNAMSAGPITVNGGVSLVIPSGSNWVVI